MCNVYNKQSKKTSTMTMKNLFPTHTSKFYDIYLTQSAALYEYIAVVRIALHGFYVEFHAR